MQKTEDPEAFPIPCAVGVMHFAKALCYVGATINLMSLSIYNKLSLRDPKPTSMCLLMGNQIVNRSIRVLQDVIMEVESFIFPIDFVILDCEVNLEVPII